MFDHEETMALIQNAQKGDEEAKTALVIQNTPLLKSIIKRYISKNVEYDDLFQIGSVGLLKAIANFDTKYNVRFSTYAVPMILGEVKRYLRDDGYIKVSRSTKQLAYKMNQYIDAYRKEHSQEPTVEEIGEYFNLDSSEVVFALDSSKMPISLYEKANSPDDNSLMLIDKLIVENKDDELIDRVILKTVINQLTPREKKIIIFRYFRDMTQGEIAEKLGVSQVQISRIENKILEKIKKNFEVE